MYSLEEIIRLRAGVLAGWTVPEPDKASPVHYRSVVINHVNTPNFGSMEIVPTTNGDVAVAQFIQAAPEIIDQLIAVLNADVPLPLFDECCDAVRLRTASPLQRLISEETPPEDATEQVYRDLLKAAIRDYFRFAVTTMIQRAKSAG